MKAIDINKRSWHFWLASKVGWKQRYYSKKLDRWMDTDFCSYVRWVILGIIVATIWGTLLAGVAGIYLYSGYYTVHWIIDMIHQGRFFKGPPEMVPFIFITGITLGVGIVLGLIWCVAQALEWRDHRRYLASELARSKLGQPTLGPTPVPKEPTFVQVAYRSIKDKVCFRINLVDSNND